jgi:dihydroorotate dehydrogenase
LLVRGLRLLPPETAHELAIRALGQGWGKPAVLPALPALRTRLLGFELAHPLGLAAGFDKNALAVPGLFKLGFSFVEIGTVTPRPQAGNPRPRLFRLPRERALINRMGFNNDGLEAVRGRLERLGPLPGPLGANIGANRDSVDLLADYVSCLKALLPLVDYLTINVSSPNTPGLRELQGRERLDGLLRALAEARGSLAGAGARKPLLLKIAPDLGPESEAEIAASALAHGIEGLVISNTTTERPAALSSRHRGQAGGLSGPPLGERANAQLARLFALTQGRLVLIGVGGISGGADAYARIRAGAAALQLYTALVYQGGSVIARVLSGLDRRLAADGYARLEDAIGAYRPPA